MEAALEITDKALEPGQKVRQTLISQLHPEMARVIHANTRFGVHLSWDKA